ncbi:hypothetical protein LCGC14_2279630 [marine sediment metagenome]|uniref:Uncharacterized protein n=1 Tax=marine sediment metagenome TaxID=412755 RepID=A0A0F9CUF0_9ZZZZ
MKLKEIKRHNFVAKHAPTSGAGRHEAKSGPQAKRAKQKQEFRKLLKTQDY